MKMASYGRLFIVQSHFSNAIVKTVYRNTILEISKTSKATESMISYINVINLLKTYGNNKH